MEWQETLTGHVAVSVYLCEMLEPTKGYTPKHSVNAVHPFPGSFVLRLTPIIIESFSSGTTVILL